MSQYAGKHLHEYIIKTKEYTEGNIVKAMEQGFLQLDKAMQDDTVLKTERSGTTVIAILIKNNTLYCVIKMFIYFILKIHELKSLDFILSLS